MKKSINFNEFILWAIMLTPFIYLASIWNSLPETVATHFNSEGVADGWGSKNTLIWLPFAMIFLTYFLMWLAPKIDPKKKLKAMGKRYDQIRWVIIGLMSALSILIIYSSNMEGIQLNNSLLYAGIGVFYSLIGNYFPTIKHNYFVGIRTPWTLENEEVWKKTHRMAGPLWMIGGVLVVLTALLLPSNLVFTSFIVLTLLMAFIPMIYSYKIFQDHSNNAAVKG